MHFFIIYFLYHFNLGSPPPSCNAKPSVLFRSVVIHVVDPTFHGHPRLTPLCIFGAHVVSTLLCSGVPYILTMNLRSNLILLFNIIMTTTYGTLTKSWLRYFPNPKKMKILLSELVSFTLVKWI
jgi:hypothetical protein